MPTHRFSQNCEGAKFLLQQFKEFDNDPTKGIDYRLASPDKIGQVYLKYPVFHLYSEKAFKTTNFKNHAALYNLSKSKDRSRTQAGKILKKIHSFFAFILLFVCSLLYFYNIYIFLLL